ncbi:MAG TPA: energy transducer TonB [Bacteroidia bacterium]|nr:energy transducer TonB [Bacteroidia bacterium]
MSAKKTVFIYAWLLSFVLNYKEAESQIINKITLYKFEEPYFMGEGISQFLYTQVNLIERDFKTGIDGKSVITFRLTREGEIKNLVVLDSTTNEHFNTQVYDAIADHPKSWEVGTLNGERVDVNMRVKTRFSKITNPASLGTGNPIGHIVNAGREVYNIIGDYEYLVDNLLSDNFYKEGVKASEENKFSDAIKFFDEVIKFSATEVDALYSRGVCKYKMDDKAGACQDWKKIQSMGKTDADKLILKYCGN